MSTVEPLANRIGQAIAHRVRDPPTHRIGKRVRVDDLWRYAEINRVQNIMRPYVEAML